MKVLQYENNKLDGNQSFLRLSFYTVRKSIICIFAFCFFLGTADVYAELKLWAGFDGDDGFENLSYSPWNLRQADDPNKLYKTNWPPGKAIYMKDILNGTGDTQRLKFAALNAFSLPPEEGEARIRFFFYEVDDAYTDALEVRVLGQDTTDINEDDTSPFQLYLANGSLKAHNGTEIVTLSAYNKNSTQKLEIRINAGRTSASVYLNGSQVGTVPSRDPGATICGIGFLCGDTEQCGTFYIDEISVVCLNMVIGAKDLRAMAPSGRKFYDNGEVAWAEMMKGWGVQCPTIQRNFVQEVPYVTKARYYCGDEFVYRSGSGSYFSFSFWNNIFNIYGVDIDENNVSARAFINPTLMDLANSANDPDDNEWGILELQPMFLADQPGYIFFYSQQATLEDPDVVEHEDYPRIAQVSIEPDWATMTSRSIDFEANYETWLAEQEKYYTYLKTRNKLSFPNVENRFLIGIYEMHDIAYQSLGITQDEYMDLYFRELKYRGFNFFMDNYVHLPAHLKIMTQSARKHQQYICAGTSSVLRGAKTPEKVIVDWGSWANFWYQVNLQLTALLNPASGGVETVDLPYLIAYYIQDDDSFDPKNIILLEALGGTTDSYYDPNLLGQEHLASFDSDRPGVVNWANNEMEQYSALNFGGAGYFYYNDLDIKNQLTPLISTLQEKSAQNDAPKWLYTCGFGNLSTYVSPSPEYLQIQTFTAIAGGVKGLAYFLGTNNWTWSLGWFTLFDSFFGDYLPAAKTASKIAVRMQGVGELIATSNQISNVSDRISDNIENASKYYSYSDTTEIWKRIHYGLFDLPDDQGSILVLINMQPNDTSECTLTITGGPKQWRDLDTYEILESSSSSLDLSFAPAEGRLIWYGTSTDWPAIEEAIRIERVWRKAILLQDQIIVSDNYADVTGLPDMSYLDGTTCGADCSMTAATFEALYQNNLAAFETAVDDTDYKYVQKILDWTKREMSEITHKVAKGTNQTLLDLASAYFIILNDHVKSGVTTAEIDTFKSTVDTAVASFKSAYAFHYDPDGDMSWSGVDNPPWDIKYNFHYSPFVGAWCQRDYLFYSYESEPTNTMNMMLVDEITDEQFKVAALDRFNLASGKKIRISFDFYEPDAANTNFEVDSNGTMQFRILKYGATDITSKEMFNMIFTNGEIKATSGNETLLDPSREGAYSLDETHHFEMIINEAHTNAHVYVDGSFMFILPVAQDSGAAVGGLGFMTSLSGVELLYVDNIEVQDMTGIDYFLPYEWDK